MQLFLGLKKLIKTKLLVYWEYWCKAIGTKAYEENHKADKVALIRTFWILLHVITCIFIILGNMQALGLF